ncbi:hypothetical protein [Marinitoga lauensis]|nr:hypothetical protein [Marinitoga lauensis]
MPLIGKEYGISDSGIYYIFSSSIFFSAFMSLIGGIIIDKFNKKKYI